MKIWELLVVVFKVRSESKRSPKLMVIIMRFIFYALPCSVSHAFNESFRLKHVLPPLSGVKFKLRGRWLRLPGVR